MKQFKKIVAANGKYTDGAGRGEDSLRHRRQSVYEGGQQRHSQDRLNAVGGEWNGWLNLYDLDDGQRRGPPSGTRAFGPEPTFLLVAAGGVNS